MRKIVFIFLIILLTGCNPATKTIISKNKLDRDMLSEYSCYNANYWDSMEDVKSIKGLEFIEETTGIVNNPVLIFEGKFLGVNCTFKYGFIDDFLSSLTIRIDNKDAKDKYEYLKQEFTDLYGVPQERFMEIIEETEYSWIDDNRNQIRLYISEFTGEKYVAYLTFADLI